MVSGLRRLGPLLFLGLGLGLALLFGYRAAFKSVAWVAPEDNWLAITGSAAVGQTIVAPFDGLNRVDVYLRPGERANTTGVTLHVRNGPDATGDLRTVTVTADAITEAGWYAFQFPPIADSGGKRYYLLFASPASNAGTAPDIAGTRQNRYRDGVLYLNGAPATSGLAFQLYSQPDLFQWLAGLGRLLAQDKPGLGGAPAFYAVLFAGFVLLLGAAVALLVAAEPGDNLPGAQ